MDSYSKKFRDQLIPQQTKPKEKIPSSQVSQMLGFIGSMAYEVMLNDIKGMINKNMRTELDGYVFAISRVVKHDLALKCLQQAFKEMTEPLPQKYLSLFAVQVKAPPKGIIAK